MAVERFLVSFLVDARGGSMCSSRHSGLRMVVPPGSACSPIRVTCRMQRFDRISRAPQLNDGDGLASRILEMGPNPHKFNSPILLEVLHFGALPDNGERELIILRSDNGTSWKEHIQEEFPQTLLDSLIDPDEGQQHPRLIRIFTSEFPKYFTLVSRLRQDSTIIGPAGGTIISTVDPNVQVTFPENALLKKIRVAVQAQPIPGILENMFGDERIAFSPVVSVEPRRRKFHKPICITITLPSRSLSSDSNNTADMSPRTHNMRLLCSISGGTSPANWEDITGSTPLSRVKNCITFTTTVSARFWLMYAADIPHCLKLCEEVYLESNTVPYVAKFVVFGKREFGVITEGEFRCFCVTDDKVDKTLECQEGFQLCAVSDEVHLLQDHECCIELTEGSNLIPLGRGHEQTCLRFHAFQENRFTLPVLLKNPSLEPVGQIRLIQNVRSSKFSSQKSDGGGVLQHLCTLSVRLLNPSRPASTMTERKSKFIDSRYSTPLMSSHFLTPGGGNEQRKLKEDHSLMDGVDAHENVTSRSPLTEEDWNSITLVCSQSVARSELDLNDIAREVNSDWAALAKELGLTRTTTNHISQEHCCETDRAYATLLTWRKENKLLATGNELERALRQMGREDVVKTCMRNITPLVQEMEIHEATRTIEESNGPRNSVSSEDETTVVLRSKVSGNGLQKTSHSVQAAHGTSTKSSRITTPVHTSSSGGLVTDV